MNRRALLASGAAVLVAGCTTDEDESPEDVSTDDLEMDIIEQSSETPWAVTEDVDADAVRADATEVDAMDLVQDIEAYEGESIYVPEASVLQAIDREDATQLHLLFGPGNAADAFGWWRGDSVTDSDSLEFWAIVDEPYTYDSESLDEQRTVAGLTIADLSVLEGES